MNGPDDIDDTAFWALFGADAVAAYWSLDGADPSAPGSPLDSPERGHGTEEQHP